MKYGYLIFDADHTLIDFDEDEKRAFRAAFAAAGNAVDERAVEACWEHSWRNWERLGLNDVHLPEIQNGYHGLYREHVRTLFDYVEQMYGLCGRRAEAEEAFCRTLAESSHPVAGAEETLRALSEKYRICVATNGLAQMQRGRLAGLAPFLYRVFISEEMGVIKPNEEFFDIMLRDLNAAAEDCLMIGDSIFSDVAGANAAGMDCVWFDRRGHGVPQGVTVTARITRLPQLCEMLL